jgi:hypothetical protein
LGGVFGRAPQKTEHERIDSLLAAGVKTAWVKRPRISCN